MFLLGLILSLMLRTAAFWSGRLYAVVLDELSLGVEYWWSDIVDV
jgi:hypothetical protein